MLKVVLEAIALIVVLEAIALIVVLEGCGRIVAGGYFLSTVKSNV